MSKESLSALGLEERILLNCARLDLTAQNRANLESWLQHRIDWEGLFQRSISQSMSPLLYRHLQSEANLWRRVPEVMRLQLEQVYERNVERNRLLLAELDQLFAVFNAEEIPVLLMKELHLLYTVYHEPGLRPIGDLDLLVPHAKFERAKALLAEAGYHPQLQANPCKDKYGFGYHFVNQQKNIWIDLQWNLSQREWAQEENCLPEFRVPIEEVWKNARSGRLQRSRIWRMSWQDLLFHLCVHLEGHGFNEMIQFCDIAEVLRIYGETVNWSSFLRAVRATGMQGSVACSLEFVRRILGVSPPVEVIAELRPDFLKFGLYNACFSTLGRLHTFLDESADDDCVPAHALQAWEATVRQTAELNLQTYATTSAIAQALADKGLQPVVLATRSPEQLLPHAALERTGRCEILISKKSSNDNCVATVMNDATKSAEGNTILPQWLNGLQKYSSGTLIKKILRARQDEQARPISVHMTTPEDTLLVLCLRFSRSSAPWQALNVVAEFIRNFNGDLNWEKFWHSAEQLKATHAAALALQGVLQLTSVEIPSVALQVIESLHLEGGVELFPLPPPQRPTDTAVKQAIQRVYRFALLSTFKDRRDYLMNLARNTSGGDKLLPTFWRTMMAIAGWGMQLLRNKLRPQVSPPAKLRAYWLEMPQVIETQTVSSVIRHRTAVKVENFHPALATS